MRLTWYFVFCLACEEEDVSPFVCDPTTQDCPHGKCSYINPAGDQFERACVSETGSDAIGAACMPLFAGNLGFGRDTCAPGLFCLSSCRATCDADSPCPQGQACARLVERPAQGFCGTPCPAFGGTCASGMTCADPWPGLTVDVLGFLTCRGIGTTQRNDPCRRSEDCGADHVCVGYFGTNTICRALCDSARPCAAGECMQLEGAVAGICFE